MKLLIACEMLRDELEKAMEETGVYPEILWMEKGLHEYPQNLNKTLQELLDGLDPKYDEVRFAMCYCGGAMNGLHSGSARLVVPRFDDCIRMLLSLEPGQRNEADARTMYFTRQWMDSDRYIVRDMESYVEKYGEDMAEMIMETMLGSYRHYAMVDTGAYDLDHWREIGKADAEKLDLEYIEQPGSIRILKKLLREDYDEEFCIAERGTALTQKMFLRM